MLAFVVVYYVVPGINVYAATTNSQKGIVEAYVKELTEGQEISSQEKAKARSAFSQIQGHGDIEGSLFIEKLSSKYPVAKDALAIADDETDTGRDMDERII